MLLRLFSIAALLCSALPSFAADLPEGRPGTLERCATPEASRAASDGVAAALERYRRTGGAPRFGTIPVAVHVITCRGEGNVPLSRIEDQIRELNRAYRGTGFAFTLSSVDRTENCTWFRIGYGYGAEKKMKQALAIDPAHHLNLYVLRPSHDLLGWAYYPSSFPETDPLHGVVVHYGSLPGGELAFYDQGATADHEVGHYLGLFHTFQGGCVEPGDYVDDTPFEASPNYLCPASRNTCPQPGDDPIHNYMDYSIDACLTEFTPLQAERMQTIAAVYRPSLFAPAATSRNARRGAATAAAEKSRTIALLGPAPHPVRERATLRFTLPRASAATLRLYDVAGKLVRELARGDWAPGEHAIDLRLESVPPGVYFVGLTAGGELRTRRLLVMR